VRIVHVAEMSLPSPAPAARTESPLPGFNLFASEDLIHARSRFPPAWFFYL
jgi:hypothetical protein